MTRLRKRQRKRFAHIDNTLLQDTRLTFRARGIAAYLLSLPDDWCVSIDRMAAATGTEGHKAIRTAMRELAEYGYLMRQRKRDNQGHLQTITIIADHPAFASTGTTETRQMGYNRPPQNGQVG